MLLRTERLIASHFRDTTFRNRAVFGLFVFVGIGAACAVWSGWSTRQKQQALRMHYQQEARKDWLSNPDKHPHRMAHYGHFAFRPKSPLSMFDFGMESFLGNTIYLEAHKQNTVNFSEAGFSTGMLRFGEISLAMVLQVLFPLLLLFLGFGSIAADRENGTLKLLLSQGVSWRQLLLGKSLGLVGVIMTLFVPIMAGTGALWLVAQYGTPAPGETLRFGLLIGFYLGYLVIFSVIVVLVSAYSRTAKTALVSLIGLWLMGTIVLPRASQALGTYLYPVPSKVRFQASIQADIVREGDSHNPDDPHYKALKDSLLAVHGVDSVGQLPFNYNGYVMAEGERISAAIYNNHFYDLLATFDRQNRFAKIMAFLNPYLAIKNLSMALSGTDFAGYVDFQEQAEAYRYTMAQRMNALQITYISNQKAGPTEKNQILDRKHWQEVPDFRYKPVPVSAVFRTESISIGAFGFWLLVLLGLLRIASTNLNAI